MNNLRFFHEWLIQNANDWYLTIEENKVYQRVLKKFEDLDLDSLAYEN